ncbi:hypothetical protein BH160DRAFT_5917 [Burkholderia sp. H160]|nr:hypothetical protein BH160DRAFT_5917 [Burkholderia sp. H160]
MNTLTGVLTMLAHTPYLAAALVVTFGLLGLEAWIVRGQSRSRAGRDAEQ